ncbi:thiamine pyrophosphate-requiring protein [Hymenobacter crusticola]|uniref:Thiamine pyrophosphate-requiring protein n=1 Tax=Hymenobacter crusticola TaxID=1770526 RepID=A0A243WAQ3_9BACT|nr:thiamine pyrophosphate-requiring protein [Hymenobacter crusticola]OUJ71929.1 thiamine pyrophosphate-requiring protein [Hymenobacter crusticola]
MSQTVSEFLIQRLSAWGIKRIFGYPGDGINGLMGALRKAKDHMEFIQVRHEEMASLMACAHAKFTGEVGVCMATSGPGAIHLLNGLYDAKLDHQPVVAIVGQKARTSLGGNDQQEVDLMSLFKDVASEYIQMATEPSQVRHLVDRAVRIAQAERTVTCVIVPNDLQELDYQEPKHEHQTIHSGIGYLTPRVLPQDADLHRAAEVLNAGKKVAILIGVGAKNAAQEVIQLADVLGAGVAKAYLGKAVLPDELPFVTGAIGLFGTNASHEMMQHCDTLFMIGSGFPYAEFLPKEGQARGVQIDLDGRMLSIRYPMEVPLTGDSAETLRALLPLLQRKEDRSWREKIEENVKAWWQQVGEAAHEEADPLNPRLVFEKLSPLLPDNVIMAADSGSSSSWMAQHIRIREGMQFSVSGTLATMGCAVPYAIAAKFAHPDKLAIAFAGDGAMQMNGNEELITIQRYWRTWADPRLIVLVLNNKDLNFVSWEQRLMQGEPKFHESQDLPDFKYAEYAESLGLIGITIDSPDQVEDAWKKALEAKRPVVIEAITDPEVLVFNAKVAMKYAPNLASAIVHGDTGAAEHLGDTLRAAVGL